MKIALDLDDTLVDTVAVLLDWIEARHGYRINDERRVGYQLGADHSQTTAIVNAFHADQADKKICALDGAVEACRRLGDSGFELVIVTSRKPDISAQTIDLVDRLFPNTFTEIHTVGGQPNKSATLRAIGAALLIDDNFRHIHRAAAAGVPTILFRDLPWNRQIPWSHRAYSWPDAVAMSGALLTGRAPPPSP
jgi:phosphoglycolate phosphatase-like HAD superfamily hydrolase